MLKQLKLLLILFTITLNILSMDQAASSSTVSTSNIDQEVNQEKALACTNLLPDLQNLIAQYASFAWKEHIRIKTDKDITSLSITYDNSKILTTSLQNGITRLLDTKTGQTLQIYTDKEILSKDFESCKRGFTCLSQTASHERVIAIAHDNSKCTIRGACCEEISMSGRITSLQFSAYDKYLAIGSFNNNSDRPDYYRRLKTYRALMIYKIEQYHIPSYRANFIENDDLEDDEHVHDIVSYGDNKFIVGTSKKILKLNIKTNIDYTGNWDSVEKEELDNIAANKLAITKDGKYLAYSLSEKDKSIIKVMDIESKKIIENLQENNIIKCFDFSPNGKYLAIGLAPRIIRDSANCFSGTMQDLERKIKKQVEDIALANQNIKNLKIWNLDLKEFSQTFNFNENVNCLKFSGDDLFVGLNNGEIVHLKRVLEYNEIKEATLSAPWHTVNVP